MTRPKLMFSSRVFGTDTEKILSYAQAQGYGGVEWYLNSFRLRTPQTRRDTFFRSLDRYPDLRYTFHLPTVDVELAHGNLLIAEASLRYMQLYIEYLAPWLQQQSEPQIITLHVGSNSIPVEELDWHTALRHLEELGRFAAERNGMVLLENLKVGWTTDPHTHLEMIQRAGLKGLTFDTGHAASNPKVRGGELKLVEYVDLLRDHIRHVHFYFYESLDKGSHIPPQEWDEVAEVWRRVVNLPHVQSVVLELSSQEELEQTFKLLMENKEKW